MNQPDKLLALLRDPSDRSQLKFEDGVLVNPANGRRYQVEEDIPILLDESDYGPQNQKMSGLYRKLSRFYDLAANFGDWYTFGRISEARRQFAEGLSLKPGDRCLYTSIGTGLDLKFMAEQVPPSSVELVGLDLSREMLRQCQRKSKKWPGLMLVQANAERLPFADATFDVVVHIGGINLFDKPDVAVLEMLRVAKPGARLQIADETPEYLRSNFQKGNPFTREACKDLKSDINPMDWVPGDVTDLKSELALRGKAYLIRFRKPQVGAQTAP